MAIRSVIYLSLLVWLAMSGIGRAQVIELDRVLIGSGFTEHTDNSTLHFSASVGEAAITTRSTTSIILSEGFQQSNYVLSNPLIADMESDSAACIGANDGAVRVTIVSGNITAPYQFAWSTGDTTREITGLETGLYTVTVTGNNGKKVTNTVRVSPRDSVDCTPHFYTGITPNGDLSNDYWHIENADFFTNKEIQIYNRYGALVWESADYDNTGAPFIGEHANGEALPDGTYFYIARFDDSTYRGWIEISR